MNKLKFTSMLSFWPIFTLLILGCDAPEGELYRVEVGKKYVLRDRPDADFLKNLDSLINSENIIDQDKQQKKVALELDVSNPIIKNPGQLPKNQNDPAQNSVGNSNQNGPVILSTQEKMDRFLTVLNSWVEDTDNSNYYRVVVVKSGQKNMSDLLKANFGQWVSELPQSVVSFSLQALNRPLDLTNLEVGQKIKVPKL